MASQDPMTPEKALVVGITCLIGVLLLLTLLRSQSTTAAQPAPPRAEISFGADGEPVVGSGLDEPVELEDPSTAGTGTSRSGGTQRTTGTTGTAGTGGPSTPVERNEALGRADRPGGFHVVVKGDTYEGIARSVYGDLRAIEALQAANPGREARRLRIGSRVRLPIWTSPQSRAPTPATAEVTAAGGVLHRVAEGEMLGSIAQHYYRRASEWPRILAANRDRIADPNRIRPGLVLRIP